MIVDYNSHSCTIYSFHSLKATPKRNLRFSQIDADENTSPLQDLVRYEARFAALEPSVSQLREELEEMRKLSKPWVMLLK